MRDAHELIKPESEYIAITAALSQIPDGVGEAMNEFLTGSGVAARQHRLKRTVTEALERLKAGGHDGQFKDNEKFGEFLEKAAQPIFYCSDEGKRQAFQNLIYNALQLSASDPRWEWVVYCLDILIGIDAVGVYVLEKISMAESTGKRIALTKYDESPLWLIVTKEWLNEQSVSVMSNNFEDIKYEYVLVSRALESIDSKYQLFDKLDVTLNTQSGSRPADFYSLSSDGKRLMKFIQ